MYRTKLRAAAAVAASTLVLTACGGSDDGATVRNIDGTGGGSASASGSASGSSSGSGSASASGVASGESAPSGGLGGYEPVSDVEAHAQVVNDVCAISDALPGDGEPDYDAARAAYSEGGSSENSDGSARTLQGFATGDRDEPLWNTAVDHFGDQTFLDDFVTEALDGTGTFAGESDAVRRQAITKGTQNHVLMMWAFHELDAAAAKLEAGETDPAEGAPHNVDEVWAFYHGASPDCAPYATASKRGEDFGTGESVNEALLAATEDMRDAAVDGDADAFRTAYDEWVGQSLVPYVQATIKYAVVVGEDLDGGDAEAARTHQAEGLAFWRVLAPYVAEIDPAVAA
ncbi:MAG: FEA1-related lipoprotein, partial [Actinobacteria bacterium]|nr:FEA1-related lipoprotein [Actinomycetota bacterium]